MAFAIGFGYAIPNLCSFGAGWWVPGIAADPNDPTGYETRVNGIGYAMGTSALVCSYSWIAGILLIMLDRNINQVDERKAIQVAEPAAVVAPEVRTGTEMRDPSNISANAGRTETFEEKQVQALLDNREKKGPSIC